MQTLERKIIFTFWHFKLNRDAKDTYNVIKNLISDGGNDHEKT